MLPDMHTGPAQGSLNGVKGGGAEKKLCTFYMYK
jgi:hypothetical protein